MLVVYVTDFPPQVEFEGGTPKVKVHAESINWAWEFKEAKYLSEYCRVILTNPSRPPPVVKPDLVYAACDSTAVHAERLARHYGCPFVVEVISRIADYPDPKWDATKKAMEKAKALIGVSPVVYRSLEEFEKKGVERHLIPHGVDGRLADSVRLFSDQRREGFLAVSKLMGHKRIEMLLEAFCRLNLNNLKVAGDGPERTGLEVLNKIWCEPAEFMGAVDDAAKFRLMCRAKALVSASKGEQFFIPAIEANFVKTPAILYDLKNLREIHEGNRAVFYFKTMDELMDLITRFSEMDGGKIAKIGEKGRKFVIEKGMTLTQRSKRVYEVCKRVIG